MPTTFPFKIFALPAAMRVEDFQFGITADVEVDPALEGHFYLFEKHGYGGGGTSWEEHILTILEEAAPDLLEHVEGFSTEANLLFYADSEAAVREFMARIQPIFADLGSLSKYLGQTDPSDFFA
ncbi:hypothetical protein [Hymenobacter aquaticus]|nr:hypothetical protein [Hymenobacter aquaticus]